MSYSFVFLIVCLAALSCSKENSSGKNDSKIPPSKIEIKKDSSMNLTSTSFAEGQPIPSKYTCDGDDISPQLKWTASLKGVKSFAIIMNDPDAPSKDFVHWIVYDIPPDVNELGEGASSSKTQFPYPQGRNDFGKMYYGGPCPPSGTHRYIIKLIALNTELNLKQGSGKNELRASLSDHVIGETEIMATYSKQF